jgi:cytochrome P450
MSCALAVSFSTRRATASATWSRAVLSHLGFGKGIHFCLGAPLARLEASRALTALLPHLPRFQIDPGADLELGDSLLMTALATPSTPPSTSSPTDSR